MTDAKTYVTTSEITYKPMNTAPLGKKVLALNEGGVCVFAVLSKDTLSHYTGWCELPKKPQQ